VERPAGGDSTRCAPRRQGRSSSGCGWDEPHWNTPSRRTLGLQEGPAVGCELRQLRVIIEIGPYGVGVRRVKPIVWTAGGGTSDPGWGFGERERRNKSRSSSGGVEGDIRRRTSGGIASAPLEVAAPQER